jgi:hypothetical protein
LPARGATGDGRDVDDVSASVGCGCPELVEEHLGSGDRAEQVDLDHPAVVVALVGGERAEQHDAGVVDEHRRTAELGLHTVCRREQTVAVGDVGSMAMTLSPSSWARAAIRSARRGSATR